MILFSLSFYYKFSFIFSAIYESKGRPHGEFLIVSVINTITSNFQHKMWKHVIRMKTDEVGKL